MCVYLYSYTNSTTTHMPSPWRHSANWSKKSYILPVSGGHKAQNTYAIQAPQGFSNEEVTVAEHKKEDFDYPNFVLLLGTQCFPSTEYQISICPVMCVIQKRMTQQCSLHIEGERHINMYHTYTIYTYKEVNTQRKKQIAIICECDIAHGGCQLGQLQNAFKIGRYLSNDHSLVILAGR